MGAVTDAERELLVEQVLTAHRERDVRGGIKASPAFYDLDDEGRRRSFDEALRQRAIEAAYDPAGRSTTVRSVLRLLATPRDGSDPRR